MTTRPAVTYEDVRRAAAELRAQGIPVTQRRVRDSLKRGSMSTLGGFLKRLREEAWMDDPEGDAARALPDPVRQGLLAGASRAWDELHEAADVMIEEVKAQAMTREENLRETTETAIAERDAALAHAADTAKTLDDTRATLAARETALAETAETVASLRETGAAERERALAESTRAQRAEAIADAQGEQLRTMQAEAAERDARASEERTRFEQTDTERRLALDAARADARAQGERATAAETRADAAEQSARDARADADAARADAHAARTKLQHHDAALAERDAALAERDALKQAVDAWRHRADEATARASAAETALAEKEREEGNYITVLTLAADAKQPLRHAAVRARSKDDVAVYPERNQALAHAKGWTRTRNTP